MTESDPSLRLTDAFTAIGARMRGLQFVNSALRVEAIGFRRWDAYWIGALVTPWFINLMLLPADAAAWPALAQGEKTRHRFPAGDFDFIAAHEDTIGHYQMCSLFSPALEFADHATARLVAQLALTALFDAAHAPRSDEAIAAVQSAPAAAAPAAPLSKREFLRGSFLRPSS